MAKSEKASEPEVEQVAVDGNNKCQGSTQYMEVSKLIVNKDIQPRKNLGDLSELKAAIKQAKGILHSLTVRPAKKVKDKFEVISGSRRLACAKDLGLTLVPVVIREDLISDIEAKAVATLLNSDEAGIPLSALERAQVYKEIMASEKGMSINAVGRKVAVSGSTVRLHIALLDLPSSVQKQVETGALSAFAAQTFAKLDTETQKSIERRLKDDSSKGEPITAQKIKSYANDYAREQTADSDVDPIRESGKKGKSTAPTVSALWRGRGNAKDMMDTLAAIIHDLKEDNKEIPEFYLGALSFGLWFNGVLDEITPDVVKTKAFDRGLNTIIENIKSQGDDEPETVGVDEEDEA